MANENNKAHELASESDEDTSELAILSEALPEDPQADCESESDAATHSFENLERKRKTDSLATLQAELRERDDAVGRLEYEVEQLRSRCTGLETELQARETATANIASELNEARQALGASRERLQRRDDELAALETRLREHELRLEEAAKALADAQSAAAAAEAAQASIEARRREAEERIAALDADLEREQGELRRAREEAAAGIRLRVALEQQHAESRSLVDTLKAYIEGRKAQWEQQDVLLRTKDTLLEEQHRKIRQYAKEFEEQRERLRAAEAETERLRARGTTLEEDKARLEHELASLAGVSTEHASERDARRALQARYDALEGRTDELRAELESLRASDAELRKLVQERERLAGELAAGRHDVASLRGQLERSEAYADALRRQVGDRAAEAEASETVRRELTAALAAASSRIDELASELEAERAERADLERLRAEEQQRFDAQLKQLRFELTNAEQTITENQTLNEQLASDLLETSSFRVALESQLSQADESYQKQVRDLTREVKKLKQQVDDSQRKIASKDAAIGVLLAELAAKPGVPAAVEEAEPVVHRLADRKPGAAEERPAQEKDKERTARLLIGTLDGQEVRFPLFKNKLTIGRTAHNDIQLKAQYISRRHAVVVCDNDNTRIVDWGSKNGIFVNGQRVSEKVLKHGDKLTVGTAEFRYEELPKR